jgi:hypothetical protein
MFRKWKELMIRPEWNQKNAHALTMQKIKAQVAKYKDRAQDWEYLAEFKAMAESFIKTQSKTKGSFEKANGQKAGQEILSWKSEFAVLFQTLADIIKETLKDALKDEFFVTDGLNDEQIKAKFALATAMLLEKAAFADSDYVEYDTTQGEVTVEFELLVYEFLFGSVRLSNAVADSEKDTPATLLYHIARVGMKYFGRNFNRFVWDNRASGEPFTFLGNCIVNMGNFAMSLKAPRLVHLVGFCGDDMIAVVDPSFSFDNKEHWDKTAIMGILGVPAKLNVGNVGTFVGRVVGNDGVYCVSPITVAQKILQKDFENKEGNVGAWKIALRDMMQGWVENPVQVAAITAAIMQDTDPAAVYAAMDSMYSLTNVTDQEFLELLNRYEVVAYPL